MDITCFCNNGVASDGNSCDVCGGDGKLTLIDANFPQLIQRWQLHGIVWNDMLTRLSDIEDKVNDVIDKCNDIKEKLDET